MLKRVRDIERQREREDLAVGSCLPMFKSACLCSFACKCVFARSARVMRVIECVRKRE